MNTIFEVVHSAGMRTAWIDKHPSYEMVSGPSGMGVDDLYTPEIGSSTRDVKGQQAYDDIKVEESSNEIRQQGPHWKDRCGSAGAFSAWPFRRLDMRKSLREGGYADASGTPSAPLLDTIEHTDRSIGKMVDALKARGLLDSTLIIISAKHAQAPMDASKHRIIDDRIIPGIVERTRSGLLALSYADGNVTSIWLTDQKPNWKGGGNIKPACQSVIGGNSESTFWGESIKVALTNDPLRDNRIPDIVVIPNVEQHLFRGR